MPMKPELERRLASLDTASAAEALVRGYGPEILGFLVALLRDDDAADEAFAVFSEDVWRGLPSFKREASYRTWAYLLARHAALRVDRADQRRRKRFGPGGTSAAEKVAWDVRSTTRPFMRTEAKGALRALRESLEQRERELLVLRIDRGLGWDDIAVVLEESPATLRKRFERTKEKLRTQAIARGLISE